MALMQRRPVPPLPTIHSHSYPGGWQIRYFFTINDKGESVDKPLYI